MYMSEISLLILIVESTYSMLITIKPCEKHSFWLDWNEIKLICNILPVQLKSVMMTRQQRCGIKKSSSSVTDRFSEVSKWQTAQHFSVFPANFQSKFASGYIPNRYVKIQNLIYSYHITVEKVYDFIIAQPLLATINFSKENWW